MPIIKSAIKKVRKDKKRTVHNKKIEQTLKGLVKIMRKTPSSKNFAEVTSKLDKAVKINLIHKNRASRLKSRLSKLLSGEKPAAPKPTPKTTPKKTKPKA